MPTYRIIATKRNAAGAVRQNRTTTVFAPCAHDAEAEVRRTIGGEVRIIGVARQEAEPDENRRRYFDPRKQRK